MLKDKKKALVIGLSLLLMSVIGNIWYYEAQRIDEPIVLQHYYEISLRQGENMMEVYYITNKNDGAKLIDIYFPKYDLQMYVKHDQIYQYKYYDLHNDYMTFYISEDMEQANIDDMILDEAVVTFNNGIKQTIHIGKIMAGGRKGSGQIHGTMSGSSSTGEAKVVYEVHKDITIHHISTNLYEESKGLVKMAMYTDHGRVQARSNAGSKEKIQEQEHFHGKNIKTIPYVPIKDISLPFKATKSLEVCTYIPAPEDERKFNVYNLRYALHFEDVNGDQGIEYLLNIDYRPDFANRSLKDFIKSRGK
ncbi:hypothetical protein HZI73_20815 [Vallitalea pronyensis]|uniref:Uncharacterized protein n=1 Tax=Vallitalea pronyensis TaxID=1348613 RepID=A0A8J8SI65_9FIRM|nr:hypothetical protein [Vallitalea pronyensis]QUI24595.1 hypothetical protein HZI73_20815 [Vallitalea pronyensis]